MQSLRALFVSLLVASALVSCAPTPEHGPIQASSGIQRRSPFVLLQGMEPVRTPAGTVAFKREDDPLPLLSRAGDRTPLVILDEGQSLDVEGWHALSLPVEERSSTLPRIQERIVLQPGSGYKPVDLPTLSNGKELHIL
ncbi:hypothetical protein IE53DRAFT_388507 [Violaceomyces palustris]|uniref:Uncharacterized protein n=1 Tax=Violaceomyces palustris TaxID=1673888 RepID=A0ACD0NU64_9BASI|nr:hypothetical protein IE53DRAFT_388507 [Violaceomyces palustris]